MSSAGPRLCVETLNGHTMSSVELQAELFELYFESAGGHVDAMRRAATDGSGSAWRASAHALKGTARTLGLLPLAARCLAAERERPSAQAVDELEAALADAQTAAAAYLQASCGPADAAAVGGFAGAA